MGSLIVIPGVEGDWKDFEIRIIQVSDTPKVLEHLRCNFYRDEPLCNNIGYEDTMAEDFDACVTEVIKEQISLVAVYKQTNKIAGVRISTITKKSDHSELPSFKSEKTKIVIGFLNLATKESKVFEKYPEIDFYAEFFMASVDRDFRGQGLLSELYNRSLELFRIKGMPLCKTVLTSPYTRKACEKKGFTELGRFYWKDYKNPETGENYFSNASPDEIITVAAIKICN